MKKKIIYSIIALSTLVASGCKDYLDINTNPNSLTSTNPDFILSGALVLTAAIKTGDVNSFAGFWGGYFAASGSYSQSGDLIRTYNITQGLSNGVWGDSYYNLSNYNYVEQNKEGFTNYAAVCEIMKAYNFQVLVDIFGNIPYSQSLTGFSYLYPKYDDQQVVYKSLATKLDSAVLLIKENPNAVAVTPASDVMFHGDMSKWAKLANTLHLRLLIRQSEVADASYITQEITKINANGYGFLTEDALINPGYSAAQNLQSPMWENYGLSYSGTVGSRDYTRVSKYTVDLLTSLSDPRIDRLLRAPGDNPGVNSKSVAYKGIEFGAVPATDNNSSNTSGFGPGIVSSAAQSAILMSFAQSLFLQAEAMQRGWLSGDAEATYKQAITQSFTALGVANATTAAATYTSSAAADIKWPSDSDGQIHAIITQKWIADYGVDATEAWSDWRRLGIPDVPSSIDPNKNITYGGTSPIRLLYPQTEYNNNPNNVAKEGTINQFTTTVFWDKN